MSDDDLTRCSWLTRDGVNYDRCGKEAAGNFCEDHEGMPESHRISAMLACDRIAVSVGQVVKAARAECSDEPLGHGFSADIQGGQVCVIVAVSYVEIHRDRLFDSYEDDYSDPSSYTYNDLIDGEEDYFDDNHADDYRDVDFPFLNVRPVVTVKYQVQDFSCPCPETLPVCVSTFTDPDDDLFLFGGDIELDTYDYEELSRIATPLELLAWQGESE